MEEMIKMRILGKILTLTGTLLTLATLSQGRDTKRPIDNAPQDHVERIYAGITQGNLDTERTWLSNCFDDSGKVVGQTPRYQFRFVPNETTLSQDTVTVIVGMYCGTNRRHLSYNLNEIPCCGERFELAPDSISSRVEDTIRNLE